MLSDKRISQIISEEISKSDVESITSRKISSLYNSSEFKKAVKKITADVKGTLSYQKKIDKNSFEVCMYPDKENDKILLKIDKVFLIIDPNNEDEYKSINGIEYINSKTEFGTINLQISNIQEV